MSLRRAWFAGALVAVSLFGDSYLYATLPIHYAEAGVSLVAVGWLLSINRWIRFVTNPLAGAIGARLGWGVTFAAAMWLAAATTTVYGLLQGAALLLAARALWGLCWSFLRLGGMAAVLADSPSGRRGRPMGIFTGIYRLGSLVAVLAGGLLTDRFGLQTTAIIFGVATVGGAIVATLPPALSGRWGAPARDPGPRPEGGTPSLRTGWIPVGLTEWLACLSGATLQLVVSGIVTGTAGLLVKERLGMEIQVGTWAVGVSAFTGMLLGSRFLLDLIVGPAAGHWADRRGRASVLITLAIALTGALLTLSQAATLQSIVGGALLLFVAGTGLATILDSWAGDLAGRSPGRFLPAYSTWQDLGAATGPLLAYYLSGPVGLAAIYAGAAAFTICVFAATTWLQHTARVRLPTAPRG